MAHCKTGQGRRCKTARLKLIDHSRAIEGGREQRDGHHKLLLLILLLCRFMRGAKQAMIVWWMHHSRARVITDLFPMHHRRLWSRPHIQDKLCNFQDMLCCEVTKLAGVSTRFKLACCLPAIKMLAFSHESHLADYISVWYQCTGFVHRTVSGP